MLRAEFSKSVIRELGGQEMAHLLTNEEADQWREQMEEAKTQVEKRALVRQIQQTYGNENGKLVLAQLRQTGEEETGNQQNTTGMLMESTTVKPEKILMNNILNQQHRIQLAQADTNNDSQIMQTSAAFENTSDNNSESHLSNPHEMDTTIAFDKLQEIFADADAAKVFELSFKRQVLAESFLMRESDKDLFAQPTPEERAELAAIDRELSQYDLSNPLNKAAAAAGKFAGSPVKIVSSAAMAAARVPKAPGTALKRGLNYTLDGKVDEQVEKSKDTSE